MSNPAARIRHFAVVARDHMHMKTHHCLPRRRVKYDIAKARKRFGRRGMTGFNSRRNSAIQE